MKEPTGERIAELDALRGIAITAVVGLHISWELLQKAPLDQASGKIIAALHLSTGFGVPLFVMLSGLGLALRYTAPMSARDYAIFMYHRASRLLPAYVVWSMIMALRADPTLLWPPGRLVSLLLTGNAGPQFYFIPLVFEFYLIWPILRPAAVAAKATLLRALAVAAVGVIVSMAYWELSRTGTVGDSVFFLPLFYLLYIASGIALAPHLKRLAPVGLGEIAAASIIAACALAFMFRGFINMLGSQPGTMELRIASTIFQPASTAYIYAAISLSVLGVFGLKQDRILAGLASLGRNSYGIFLVHLLVLEAVVGRVLEPPMPEHFASGWWVARTFATSLLCLGISYGITHFLARHSKWGILVGSLD